jgi:DNA-binding MarR family transcriptional regulator
MTLKQIADETSNDAPATTVAINDLENRGLVERNPHPENRRAKLVSLTPAGQQIVQLVRRTVRDDAPPAMQHLSKTDLAHLRRILERVDSRER